MRPRRPLPRLFSIVPRHPRGLPARRLSPSARSLSVGSATLGAGAMAHGTPDASKMTRLAELVDFFPNNKVVNVLG